MGAEADDIPLVHDADDWLDDKRLERGKADLTRKIALPVRRRRSAGDHKAPAGQRSRREPSAVDFSELLTADDESEANEVTGLDSEALKSDDPGREGGRS